MKSKFSFPSYLFGGGLLHWSSQINYCLMGEGTQKNTLSSTPFTTKWSQNTRDVFKEWIEN